MKMLKRFGHIKGRKENTRAKNDVRCIDIRKTADLMGILVQYIYGKYGVKGEG